MQTFVVIVLEGVFRSLAARNMSYITYSGLQSRREDELISMSALKSSM